MPKPKSKSAPRRKAAAKPPGNLIDAGHLTTVGGQVYPRCLMIQFDTEQAVRDAINARQCSFRLFDPATVNAPTKARRKP